MRVKHDQAVWSSTSTIERCFTDSYWHTSSKLSPLLWQFTQLSIITLDWCVPECYCVVGCGHWGPAGLPPELKTYLDCRQTGEKKSGRYGYVLNLWSEIAQLHRHCRFFIHISVLHMTGFMKRGHILYFNKFSMFDIFKLLYFHSYLWPKKTICGTVQVPTSSNAITHYKSGALTLTSQDTLTLTSQDTSVAVVLFPEKFTAIEKHHELKTCDGTVLRL